MISRLLDSVIIIDHLNGVKKASRYLLGLDPEETAISVITRAEIIAGIEEGEMDVVKALLDQYSLFNIDVHIADLAGTLRKKYGWKLPDAFQAAFCLNHNIRLITRNTKDFDPKIYDFVDIPYSL